MLAQNLQRKDAKTQRRKEWIVSVKKEKVRRLSNSADNSLMQDFSIASLRLCALALVLLSFSCGSKPTDMRTLVPAETLVYLETDDLAAALQPIVDNKAFEAVAKSKPDFSALKGVQLAVAVTGFETSEEKLTDEHSIGRVQPHFVAVAETHAWNYQAVAFAEKKLGSFVENIYGSEPALEKSDKNGGKYFIWTAKDGRKAFALVIDSLIYFGNDETAIEKCLAVKRGESDSILKTGKIAVSDPTTLASGYVSTDGITQLAGLVGLKFASEAGEDSEVQSAIAGILPELLRSSITEIRWTATKTEQGIEDTYSISTKPEIAQIFSETLAPGGEVDKSLFDFLSFNLPSVTLYNFKDPRIAWRSILLSTQKQNDPLTRRVIPAVSGAFFEPYGIRDPERFLNAINSNILTAKLDAEGEKPVVAAIVRDLEEVKKSISKDIKPPTGRSVEGGDFWKSDDNSVAALFYGGAVVLGDSDGVQKLEQESFGNEHSFLKYKVNKRFVESKSPIITVGQDPNSSSQIATVLSGKKSDDAKAESTYFTETRFTKTGMERRTVSDFGLIGSIIAQLSGD